MTPEDIIRRVHQQPNNSITVSAVTEFSWELGFLAPYAYYLFRHNKLKNVISFPGTKSLYFFTNAFETYRDPDTKRIGTSIPISINTGLVSGAEITSKSGKFDTRLWEPPPYKKHFSNSIFRWSLPTFVIHNKPTNAWGRERTFCFLPLIPLATIGKIFRKLKGRYKIVYIGWDKSVSKDFSEDIAAQRCRNSPEHKDEQYQHRYKKYLEESHDLFVNHPEVTLFSSLQKQYHQFDYNTLQFMVHANSDKFLSVTGGTSFIPLQFGGINIVYPSLIDGKLGYVGDYLLFSGAHILDGMNKTHLLGLIDRHF